MYTNLLELVLPIIYNVVEPQTGVFKFRSMVGESVNEIGVPVPSYSEWVECFGTVQPVNRSRYEALGLDWSKKYINCWGSCHMNTVDANLQPTQVLWQGMLWNVTSVDQWDPHDGWVHVTACQDKRYGIYELPSGQQIDTSSLADVTPPDCTVKSIHDWAEKVNKVLTSNL